MNLRRTISYNFALLIVMACVAVPFFTLAQSEPDDLRAAIQASVLSDPRTANIPPQELEALVDQMTIEAEAQNMSPEDIQTQSQAPAVAANAVSACEPGWQGIVCQINHTFGFEGENAELAIVIFVLSGLLLVVLWELRQHHRKKI